MLIGEKNVRFSMDELKEGFKIFHGKFTAHPTFRSTVSC